MKETDDILNLISQRRLGEALALIDKTPQVNPSGIEDIRADFQRMGDYMMKGYDDPEREQLYNKLLQRAYTAVASTATQLYIEHTPILLAMRNKVRTGAANWSIRHIEEQLQNFVMELAVADLENRPTDELYDKHTAFLTDLFDYIITSRQWSQSVADGITQMLLSPTIDTSDQQLLTAAIIVSNIEQYDPNKFQLLVNLYLNSTDEGVRQRALVGWAVSMSGKEPFRQFERQLTDMALEKDERTAVELTELQMQLVYCITAVQDNRTLREEIIPGLIKGNGIRIKLDGSIEENDGDSMQDILNPEKAEQNMEEMERSMERMNDMQRQGADVFFSGFSQMKRFSFFQPIANWFIPYSNNHPSVRQVAGQMKDNRFFQQMIEASNFCDSDKYSFVLAMTQVWSKMPENVKNLLENGEVADSSMLQNAGKQNRPAVRRRSFLQDIYRFYSLYQYKSVFRNPFKTSGTSRQWLPLANPIFQNTPVEQHFIGCVKFLYKKGLRDEAIALLDNCSETTRGYPFFMLRGTILHQENDFQQALSIQPDDEAAMRGLAKTAYAANHYDTAAECFRRLAERHPDKQSYQLNLAICQACLEQYDEAEQTLYRLHFDSPDDTQVADALAWTLMEHRCYEKAEAIYNQNSSADPLNAAFCKWLLGKTAEAFEIFKNKVENPADAIGRERDFLLRHGISSTDILLMQQCLFLT